MTHSRRRDEHGAALLAVVLLVAATAATTAALVERAGAAAAELRARRAVLCARYAALGGLALGVVTSDGTAATLLAPRVDSLVVSRVRLSSSWCVLRATASCAGATRTLDHTLADASRCNSTAP